MEVSSTREYASDLPSCGELERSVGQAIQKSYRQHLGHLPTRVSCHLFADKLSVWIEDSLTPVESILFPSDSFATEKADDSAASDNRSSQREAPQSSSNTNRHSLKQWPLDRNLQEIRFAIDQAMQKQFSKVIEECLCVEVTALISGTCYEQNCTGLTALLSSTPAVRNPDRIPKTAASRQATRKATIKVNT